MSNTLDGAVVEASVVDLKLVLEDDAGEGGSLLFKIVFSLAGEEEPLPKSLSLTDFFSPRALVIIGMTDSENRLCCQLAPELLIRIELSLCV